MNSYNTEKNVMESKKKNKKSKKEKKSKKHKSKDKKKRMSSSESESESDGMEWVEVTAETKKPEVQREEWMCQESFVPTLSKEEMLANDSSYRRKACKDKKEHLYEPGQHERELNPYWKDGGKGVPEDSPLEIKLSSSLVNDGGLSHLKKAYKRIEEQAEEEGRTMEEIAAERWGSLDKLKSLIAEAEERMGAKNYHCDRRKDRYQDYHDRKREHSHDWKRDSAHRKHGRNSEVRYEREKAYDKNMFKRPHQESAEDYQETRHSGKVSQEPAWQKKKPPTEQSASSESRKESSYDKSMFKRPSQERIEKRQESSRAGQSSHQPAWMKKKPSQEQLTPDNNTAGESSLKSVDCSNSKKNSHAEETLTNVPSKESVFLTDNEMNNLAAKILKAEMRGDTEMAAQLQSKLDYARDARKSGLSATSAAEKKRAEEVVLSKVDSHGTARPLVAPDYPVSSSKKKGRSYDKMSKVKSYFSEESEHSLKKMFEREKLTTADDQIEMFVDAALESRGLTDQDYEIGDISAKVARKMGQQRQDERDYTKAIQEHKRLNIALEKCEYCFEKMKKHLIISDSQQQFFTAFIGSRFLFASDVTYPKIPVASNIRGEQETQTDESSKVLLKDLFKAYLCLPSYQSLTEDHCLIVPKAHVSSSLLLDEDVAEEIKNFKKILVRMFREHNKCVAFVETSINLKYSPHLVIECFPMPVDVGDIAPMYFKKAIQEHGSEWANNKKLIDLFKKDLKHSVPKGLPYFAVEFSQGGGYAHVVEDRDFPKHFGKEIIGGMLEIDSHLCARYRREDFKDQAKKVLHFTNIWKSYTDKKNIVL